MNIVVADVKCPTCGAGEMHPTNKHTVLIRAHKVHSQGAWWSQCLVCAGYYNPTTLKVNPPSGLTDKFNRVIPQGFDEKKGWFRG